MCIAERRSLGVGAGDRSECADAKGQLSGPLEGGKGSSLCGLPLHDLMQMTEWSALGRGA